MGNQDRGWRDDYEALLLEKDPAGSTLPQFVEQGRQPKPLVELTPAEIKTFQRARNREKGTAAGFKGKSAGEGKGTVTGTGGGDYIKIQQEYHRSLGVLNASKTVLDANQSHSKAYREANRVFAKQMTSLTELHDKLVVLEEQQLAPHVKRITNKRDERQSIASQVGGKCRERQARASNLERLDEEILGLSKKFAHVGAVQAKRVAELGFFPATQEPSYLM